MAGSYRWVRARTVPAFDPGWVCCVLCRKEWPKPNLIDPPLHIVEPPQPCDCKVIEIR